MVGDGGGRGEAAAVVRITTRQQKAQHVTAVKTEDAQGLRKSRGRMSQHRTTRAKNSGKKYDFQHYPNFKNCLR